MIHIDNIPASLKNWPQWVVHNKDKVPHNIQGKRADITNSSQLSDFETAFSVYKTSLTQARRFSGIGFAFTKNDPFVGIDLDHCRDPETGKLEVWAQSILQQFNSYSEVSPSGKGLHIYIKGRLPKTVSGRKKPKIEIYQHDRYFTVTGNRMKDYPAEIMPRQEELNAFYSKTFDPLPAKTEATTPVDTAPDWWVQGPVDYKDLPTEDKTIIEKAFKAQNGHKFQQLWAGNWSASYPSQSEADLALVNQLAWWCKGDLKQIDRIFRASELYRPKWDEYRGHSPYGLATIKKSLMAKQDDAENDFSIHSSLPVSEPRNPFAISDIKSIGCGELGLSLPVGREWFFSGEGGLPCGKLGLLSGSGGTGKSFIGLQICASVSSGVNCVGGALQIKPQGAALAVLSEEAIEDVGERIFYIRKNSPAPLDLKNLYLIAGPGDYRLVKKDMAGNLIPSENYTSLLNLIKRIPDLKFIFIDPASKFLGSVDENSNTEATYFLSLLEMFVKTSGANLLLSVHTNKSSTTNLDNLTQLENSLHQNSIRGASSFVNDSRWAMSCCAIPSKLVDRLKGGENTRLMAWKVAKNNYAATTSMKFFERGEGGVLKPFELKEKNMDDIQRLVEAINQSPIKLTRRTALDHLPKHLGTTKSSVSKLIEAALDVGMLTEQPGKNANNVQCSFLIPWLTEDDMDFLL